MAKYCPIVDGPVLYFECLECDKRNKCKNYNAAEEENNKANEEPQE